MAENRTRINCLEGSYADHYTTNALYMLLKNTFIINKKLYSHKLKFVLTQPCLLAAERFESLLSVSVVYDVSVRRISIDEHCLNVETFVEWFFMAFQVQLRVSDSGSFKINSFVYALKKVCKPEIKKTFLRSVDFER